MSTQPASRYDSISLVFHWLTAILVAITFILGPEHFGRLMRSGLDPATRSDIVWHETLGLAIFLLTFARIAWSKLRPTPPTIEMPKHMHLAAKGMQLVLGLLMLILPVTAILALGGEGHPLTLLGGVRVDSFPLIADSGLAHLADWGEVHGFLGDTIIALAGLHAAAAIYHHVFLKDGTLLAMSPFGGVRR